MIALLNNLASIRIVKFIIEYLSISLFLVINSVHTLLALVAVIVYFIPYSAFMGLRYCYRRRRNPEEFTSRAEAQARRIQRTHARYARKKKPRLMSQAQVDEKFPICSFKQAKVEQLNMPPLSSSSINTEDDDSHVDRQSSSEFGEPVDESAETDGQINDDNNNVRTPGQQQEGLPRLSIDQNDLHRTTTGRSVHSIIGAITSRAFDLGPSIEAQNDAEELEEQDHLEDLGDDTCAICIEIMNEDSQVRLLTCGHIFHAECVDPWLTTRRAYCPLCKHDYYVPVPEEDENTAAANTNPPQPPQPARTQSRMSSSNLFRFFNRRRSRTNASELSQASSEVSGITESSDISEIHDNQAPNAAIPMAVIPEASVTDLPSNLNAVQSVSPRAGRTTSDEPTTQTIEPDSRQTLVSAS